MNRLILILTFLVMAGCVEPYDFEAVGTERVLVVDASLSNEQKSHETKLSYTYPLDARENAPATGAEIWIESAGELVTQFIEDEPGVYRTDSLFAGIIGRSYVLHISLGSAKLESTEEIIKPPIPFDTIYGRYLELPSDEDASNQLGVQIFVDVTGATEGVSFRYEYEETYEIRVPYPSLYSWDSDSQTYSLRDPMIGTCYKTNKSTNLLLGSTASVTGNDLLEFPIRFLNQQEPELRSVYSIFITQFTISEKAYQFYRDLQENNESAGGLFDRQKGTSVGNLTVINNRELAVLGYFETAGVVQERTFFRPDSFRVDGFSVPRNLECATQIALDTASIGEFPEYFTRNPNFNIVNFIVQGVALTAFEKCTDCRLFGDLQKPDFWE